MTVSLYHDVVINHDKAYIYLTASLTRISYNYRVQCRPLGVVVCRLCIIIHMYVCECDLINIIEITLLRNTNRLSKLTFQGYFTLQPWALVRAYDKPTTTTYKACLISRSFICC